MESFISILLSLAGLYLLAGALFALAFLPKGITKVDEDAKGTSVWFRLIILPGVIIFWPALLKKWIQSNKAS